MSTSISTFLPPLPRRSHATFQKVRKPSPERASLKSAIIACAFFLLNLGIYLSAGYLGMQFFKWAWYRFFG